MSRNTNLIKNTSFVVIGSLGSKIMGFIMLPLYTHWLSPSEFGIADMISTYALLLLNVVACDISDAIFVFPVGKELEDVKRYYSSGFIFQIFCAAICALVFYIIGCFSVNNTFFIYIWFIYGVLITSLFQKYTQDFCRAIKKMSVFSYTGIIQSVSLACMSFLFIPQMKLKGFILATVLSNLLTASFTFIYSNSYSYLSLHKFDLSYLKEMLRYSLPLIPTALTWWLISSLNRPLMEEYCGVFTIGLFAVAQKFPSLINMIFNFFQQAWVVTVLEEFRKVDFAAYYNKMFRIIFSIQVLGCIILTIFSKYLLKYFTSDKYESAWVYIPILSLSVLFSNTSAFCGTVFTACKKSKYILYSVIIGGMVALLANFLLIPTFNIWGACFAICLSHAACTICRIIMSSKIVNFENTSFVLFSLLSLSVCMVGINAGHNILKSLFILISLLMYIMINKSIIKSIYVFISSKKIEK